MITSIVDVNRRKYQAKAEQCLRQGDFKGAGFYTLKAAECTFTLAEECGGPVGKAWAQEAYRLLETAEGIKKLMIEEQKNPNKKKKRNPFLTSGGGQEGGEGAEAGEESQWLIKGRPSERLADVAGLEELKQVLKDRVIDVFNKPEAYKTFNLKGGGGVLMYGPPGTGKTFLARAVAGELDAAFFYVNGATIKDKYVGETEKKIARLFEEARQHERSIIFIDECDALLAAPNDSVKVNSVNQFLASMGGFEESENLLLVLAATNKPWLLDSGIIRSKRLGIRILVGPPDMEARKAILEAHLKGVPLVDNFPYRDLAEATEGYSGADIEALCDQMKILAVRRWPSGQASTEGSAFTDNVFAGRNTVMDAVRITVDDAKAALDTVKPTITPEMNQKYMDWKAKWEKQQS